MTDRSRAVVRLVVAFVLLMVPVLAVGQQSAQQSKSAELAGTLVKLLDSMKLDSIAARVQGDQYVAALYFPGSQLLVVKARYIVPERMDEQIQKKAYRDVYIDLNSASVPGSKVLISDGGADGLHPARRANHLDTADIGGKSYSFDGEWRRIKLSEQEYVKTFQASEADYITMLGALVDELRKPS